MTDLTPSLFRLQPCRFIAAAFATVAFTSCGTAHKRVVDRACYDDLKIFSAQQSKIEGVAGDVSNGGLTRAQVQAGMKAVEAPAKACEEHLLPNERDGGKIVFDFLVSSNGKVAKACATESNYDNPEFNACVLRAVRSATFAKPAKGAWTTVRYPIKFE